MTIVGEAFVRIVPDGSDFGSTLQQQITSATSGIASKLAQQFAQAGNDSGASFVRAATADISSVTDQYAQAGAASGAGFVEATTAVAGQIPGTFAQAGAESSTGFLSATADVANQLPLQFAEAGADSGKGFAEGAGGVTAKLPEQFAQAGAAAGQGFAQNVQGPIVESTSDIVVGLQDKFASAGLLSGNAFVDKLTRGVSAIGGPKAAAAAAGIAIVAAVVGTFSSIGGEFGKVRKQIAIETGATAKTVESLFDAVKRSVLTIPASLDDAGAAFALLFKRGVPVGPLLDRLAKQELTLARITKADLAGTVESTTAVFAKFNVPLREQSKSLDVLFKASQRSGKSLQELVDPLLSGGAALQEFGFNLSESAALITQLQIAGVNVQPALASLRKAFASIVAEGGDPREALTDLIAKFKSGVDPAETMAEAMKLFGSRAGLELATAIRSGKFEIDDLLKIITNGKDGIDATGAAALGLGEKFLLLRNQVEANFAEIGTSVRKALSSFLTDATGPVVALGSAFAHLITSLAPLAKVFAPFGLLLQAVLPALGAFATGLDGIASVLDLLDNPIGIVTAGLATVALAMAVSAAGAHALAFAVGRLTLALVTNPYVLAAVAIISIGVAIQTFRSKVDPAIAVAKKMSDAMFTIDDASTIFANGMNTATGALDAFFTAQARSKDSNFIKGILAASGSTVEQLTTAVTGSATAWDQYADAARAAFEAAGLNGIEISALTEQLQAQRDAFALTATVQAQAAISMGVLTRAQKNQIVEQNRFADGSVNLVGVLDEINSRLAASVSKHNDMVLALSSTKKSTRDLAQQLASGEISTEGAAAAIEDMGLEGDAASKLLDQLGATAALLVADQDRLKLSSLSTSKAYGLLATAIATGQISQVDATTALETMGLSAEGAGTAFADLQERIKTFVDGALSALPTVADAVSRFQSAISSDKGTLESDLAKRADLQKQFAEAGGKASDELRASIVENNAAIRADFQKLAEDSSPKKFTAELLENAKQITLFNHNIRVLVGQGLGALAGDLAQLGPEQAGQLAAALASNPSQAKVANAAAELGDSATASYKKTLEENFGALALTGEAAGKAVGTGIAKGIIAELVKQIPGLKEFGIGAGNEVDKGAKEGIAGKTTITDEMKASLGRHIPEFRGLGVPIGTNTMDGAKEGIGRRDLGASIETAIRRGGGKVREAGVSLGTAAGEGIAAGIRAQFDNVGHAVLIVTQHGVAVAKSQWAVTSPSKVFAEIGSQVGAGLVVGITGSARDVGEATRLLASKATTTMTDALVGLEVSPDFRPTVTPTVGPIVLPPIDAPPPVEVTAALGPIAPVVLDATFRPVEVPQPEPLTLDGTVVAALPSFDPIVLSGSFARVLPPDVPDAKIDATVSATVPPFDAVSLSGFFAPVEAPALDPIALSGVLAPLEAPVVPPTTVDASVIASLPAFDPVVFTGSVAPVDPPTFDPLVLDARLVPIPDPTFDTLDLVGALAVNTPNVAPLTLTANIAPFTVPQPAPLNLAVEPLDVPRIDPLVIDSALAPFDVPQPPPINLTFVPPVEPEIPSVVIPTRLAPFTVPTPPALDVTLGPIPVPDVPSVVVPSRLAPFTVPTPRPLDITLGRVPTPEIDPVVVSASLAPLTVPTPAPIAASLAVATPEIAPVVVPASLAPVPAPPVDPIVASFAPFPTIDLPRVEMPPVETPFAPIVPPVLPTLTATIAPVSPLDLDTAFAGVEAAGTRAGATAAQGLADSISVFTPTIDATKFAKVGRDAAAALTPAIKSALGGVGGAGVGVGGGVGGPGQELVDGFKKAFGTIKDDAEQLRRFLAGLGGTKLAFDEPPSKLTIAAAAQSIQVAKPEDRINAQKPPEPVVRAGLFDGAVVNFPKDIDPLHIANEIAWMDL